MNSPYLLWHAPGGGIRARLVGYFETPAAAEQARRAVAGQLGLPEQGGEFEIARLQGDRPAASPYRPSFATLISWMPLAAFLVLMSFPLVAMSQIGHWPYYAHPDPKELDMPKLYLAAFLSIPLGFITAFIGLLSMACEPKGWRIWHRSVYFLGVMLWTVNLGTLGGLLSWLFD